MKRFHMTVNGKAYDVQVEEVAANAAAPVAAAPAAAAAPAPVAAAPAPVAAAPAAPATAGGEAIKAPMPGTVLDVKVAAGQAVKKGDILLLLEAMKMENEILAPHDATVASVAVNKGDSVDSGALLLTLA